MERGAPTEACSRRSSYVQISTYWAHAVAAGHLHDGAATQEDALKHYDELRRPATRRNGSAKPYLDRRCEKNEHSGRPSMGGLRGASPTKLFACCAPLRPTRTKLAEGETELPAREMRRRQCFVRYAASARSASRIRNVATRSRPESASTASTARAQAAA